MISSRIKQRYDVLSNWISNDIVLLKGELAVVSCDDQIRFKVGDGTSRFTQLDFIDQHQLCTDWLTAKAISQGIHSQSVPYGLAAGAFLCANANFSQVFGYNAESLSSDQYSFTWNGDSSAVIGDRYQSHGQGTFSINPEGGVSGVYIGEQSLAEMLSSSGSKVFIDDHISGVSGKNDLSVVKLSADEYASLLTSNSLLSNAIYIVEKNSIDAYGQQVKNVAAPTDLSDAATKEYVDNAVSSNILSSLSIYKPYNDTLSSLSADGYVTLADVAPTLGSISKALIAQIEAPKASVNSIQQTLLQLLSILSGGTVS